MVLPRDPPPRRGIREATGPERPSPGILCWNCRTLTPFPSGACKWCGAAFAGVHGGAYGDQIPEITVRAPVSSPAAARGLPKNLKPIVRRLGIGESASEPRPVERATAPSRVSTPPRQSLAADCPVCGRPSAPGARRCQCGALFGDAPTTFNCAECGSVLPMQADHCFVCGVAFGQAGLMYACPLCGASVPEAATTCRCGARFVD